MSRGPQVAALVLLAGLAAGDLQAAVECENTDTPLKCWTDVMAANRVAVEASRAAVAPQAAALAAEEAQDLKNEPTGLQTGGGNLASNTTDFLPLLSLAGLVGDGQEGDTPGTYVLDLNFLIPGLARDKNSKLQGVVNTQPQVPEALKTQIPEAQRDDVVKKLQESLGDLSDYTLSYTFNWMDERHGRGFNHYRNRISSLVAAVSRSFEVPETDATRRLLEVLADMPGGQNLFTQPFQDMGDQGPAVKAAVEAALSQEINLLAEHRKAWDAAGLNRLGSLLDNQPQLTFMALRRFRNEVLGGDETAFRVTYEWGVDNFNQALSARCDRELDVPDPSAIREDTLQSCLDEFSTYVATNVVPVARGDRLSVSAEYLDVEENRFDLPQFNLAGLALSGAKKLVVQAGWGREFPAGRIGSEPLRLDLVAKYEDVSDDPQRRDRGVATLTVTRQFGDLAVPFGIVYANHGEYLGEVDEQFSAHLGLKFDLEGLAQTLWAPGR